jgi:hypothetical protein
VDGEDQDTTAPLWLPDLSPISHMQEFELDESACLDYSLSGEIHVKASQAVFNVGHDGFAPTGFTGARRNCS